MRFASSALGDQVADTGHTEITPTNLHISSLNTSLVYLKAITPKVHRLPRHNAQRVTATWQLSPLMDRDTNPGYESSKISLSSDVPTSPQVWPS